MIEPNMVGRELKRLKAELKVAKDRVATLTAERDQARAEVAVLTEALTKVRSIEWNLAGPANIDHAGRWYINREVHELMMDIIAEALSRHQEATHAP